ncbi:MAG: DUF4065 domain-containing protein [Desulfovibrio sp.]|nr:DUF4065 domain-containing protein [Desulfovibrio sp.]
MAHAKDVAQYIIECTPQETISAIKLEKLVYYCQAWSLAWTGEPLFEEDIQAWANGPVIPNLYKLHVHKLNISKDDAIGDSSKLSENEKSIINDVLQTYIDKEPFWLVELTHLERPWKEARRNCQPGEICTNVITQASMAEYYSSIMADSNG